MTYDVGYLVVAAIVHTFHRVQNSTLYGFQSVAQMGYGTLQDYVAGVIQKPVLIHAAKMMNRCGIKAVAWFIVGVLFRLFNLFNLVVHSFFMLRFLVHVEKIASTRSRIIFYVY